MSKQGKRRTTPTSGKTPDLLGVLAARTAAELEAAASDLERIEKRREAALARLRAAKQVGNILLKS